MHCARVATVWLTCTHRTHPDAHSSNTFGAPSGRKQAGPKQCVAQLATFLPYLSDSQKWQATVTSYVRPLHPCSANNSQPQPFPFLIRNMTHRKNQSRLVSIHG
jgi:hypothetical protein